jgi:hypothetical protein
MATNTTTKTGRNATLSKIWDAASTNTVMTKFAVGVGTAVASESDTTLDYPISKTPTTVNSCEVIGDWTASADGAGPIVEDVVTFKEGTGSIQITKSGGASATLTYYDDQAGVNLTSNYVYVWVYIKDSTALAKLQTNANSGIFVRLSSANGGATNYSQWIRGGSDTSSVGWNLLKIDIENDTPDSTNGAYDKTSSKCWMLGFTFTGTAITTTAGDILMDYWHRSAFTYYSFASAVTFDTTNNTVTSRGTILASEMNGFALSEVGTFNTDASPVMFGRHTFSPVSKSSTDIITFQMEYDLIS